MRYDWNLLLMSYGKTYVAQRRIVQQEFQPAVVMRLHRPVIVREVTALLCRLLVTPHVGGAEMVNHFRQYVIFICRAHHPHRAHIWLAPLQPDGCDYHDDDVRPPGYVCEGPFHRDRRNSP